MDFKNIFSNIGDGIESALGIGSKSVIGIDIGLSAVKLAEVVPAGDGMFKINKFTIVELPEGAIIEDEIQKEDDILQALQKGIKELNSKSKNVCLGFSGPNTLIKRLQLPGGSLDEIDDQVSWETEQYLPFPIDEGNISFSVVGENQGGGVDVIIGALKRSTLGNFKDLVERTGLKVKIADLNAAATLNVFESVLGREGAAEGKTWILLDIGAQKTHFMIYKNGVMVFYKEINIGGLTITEEIQRQMGVNYDEAESLKIQGDGSGNIPEEIIELINQVLDIFFTELKKTVDYWANTASEEEFSGCYITGGCALIPGLSDALQELFESEVHVLNPFTVMTYNQNNIKENMINEIAYKGVCAIGLAMRSLPK